MNDQEKEELRNNLVDAFRPEAKTFTEEMLNDRYKTTQNNYGKVMSTLSQFEKIQPGIGRFFLLAMVKEGYPPTTAKQIRQIMGWA
jgi:hypothetical protein